MTDPAPDKLVERLRAYAGEPWATIGGKPFMLEAAAAIQRLTEERAELRRSLELCQGECDAAWRNVESQKKFSQKQKDRAESAEAERDRLRAEVERMRPVIEAARNWRDGKGLMSPMAQPLLYALYVLDAALTSEVK